MCGNYIKVKNYIFRYYDVAQEKFILSSNAGLVEFWKNVADLNVSHDIIEVGLSKHTEEEDIFFDLISLRKIVLEHIRKKEAEYGEK